ncbi:MAG: bifunctional DNA-formamidopyrimidine glycosylase/DNA-(apurinic or apyrimidinic site) lyase, partial [Alphaproteobacteria bacterium]
RRLARVEVRRRDLRRPVPADLARRAAGQRITAVTRRAKYLLLHLDGGAAILIHLGMSGRILVTPADAAPALTIHDHVRFLTDDGVEARFTDPRRFGVVDLVAPGGVAGHPLLAHLGPEPLATGDAPEAAPPLLNGALLMERLAGRTGAIKPLLLDQRMIAGLGNIYASEALYRAGLSPRRRAHTIRGGRAERLARAIGEVLQEAVAAGGSSLRDYRDAAGELGYFQHDFRVYDRAGRPCPDCDCDSARTGGIRRLSQGGRSTFYCPRRQR